MSSNSGRRRRKVTPEFKTEAMAMVAESGGKIAQVAKELGIYESSLGSRASGSCAAAC